MPSLERVFPYRRRLLMVDPFSDKPPLLNLAEVFKGERWISKGNPEEIGIGGDLITTSLDLSKSESDTDVQDAVKLSQSLNIADSSHSGINSLVPYNISDSESDTDQQHDTVRFSPLHLTADDTCSVILSPIVGEEEVEGIENEPNYHTLQNLDILPLFAANPQDMVHWMSGILNAEVEGENGMENLQWIEPNQFNFAGQYPDILSPRDPMLMFANPGSDLEDLVLEIPQGGNNFENLMELEHFEFTRPYADLPPVLSITQYPATADLGLDQEDFEEMKLLVKDAAPSMGYDAQLLGF